MLNETGLDGRNIIIDEQYNDGGPATYGPEMGCLNVWKGQRCGAVALTKYSDNPSRSIGMLACGECMESIVEYRR